MYLPVDRGPLRGIELGAAGLYELVDAPVGIGDEIEASRPHGIGVPYRIDIRVDRNGPAQEHRLEVLFADELVKESGPRHHLYVGPDAYPGPLTLDHRRHVLPHLVSLVGRHPETELFPVLFQYAVAVGVPPPGLPQELCRFLRVMIVSGDLPFMIDSPFQKRSRARLAQPEKNGLYYLVPVDGVAQRLPDPSVREERVFQVISYICIRMRQVAVFIYPLPELACIAAVKELVGVEVHGVHLPGGQFQELDGLVGDYPVHVHLYVRFVLKVAGVRFENDVFTCLPPREHVGAGADRRPGV